MNILWIEDFGDVSDNEALANDWTDEIAEVVNNIKNIVKYTIKWFQHLKSKYGKGRERRTEIRNFENIGILVSSNNLL